MEEEGKGRRRSRVPGSRGGLGSDPMPPSTGKHPHPWGVDDDEVEEVRQREKERERLKNETIRRMPMRRMLIVVLMVLLLMMTTTRRMRGRSGLGVVVEAHGTIFRVAGDDDDAGLLGHALAGV